MRRSWWLAAIAVVALLVLAFAWVSGGREPLRDIAQPVAVPEIAR